VQDGAGSDLRKSEEHEPSVSRPRPAPHARMGGDAHHETEPLWRRVEVESLSGWTEAEPRLIDRTLGQSVACGAAVLLAITSGRSPATCQDIVNEYKNEMVNADFCDPTMADACSVLLPVVLAVEEPDGGLAFDALGNCNVGFNPARSAKLAQLPGQGV